MRKLNIKLASINMNININNTDLTHNPNAWDSDTKDSQIWSQHGIHWDILYLEKTP